MVIELISTICESASRNCGKQKGREQQSNFHWSSLPAFEFCCQRIFGTMLHSRTICQAKKFNANFYRYSTVSFDLKPVRTYSFIPLERI